LKLSRGIETVKGDWNCQEGMELARGNRTVRGNGIVKGEWNCQGGMEQSRGNGTVQGE